MQEVNRFDFSKYDVGGNGATAGDGKLTGAEVAKAKADGWTVWDGYSKNDKPEKNKEESLPKSNIAEKWGFSSSIMNKLANALNRKGTIFCSSSSSSSYREYENLAKQKFAEYFKRSMDTGASAEKAKKEALHELGLSEDAFDGLWDDIQFVEYFGKDKRMSIPKEVALSIMEKFPIFKEAKNAIKY